MIVIKHLSEWRSLRADLQPNIKIGFVATMGNLHHGHLSLLKRSIAENDKTIISIYVNPTQFNDSNDLKQYPRTLEQDLTLLKSCGVDYVLTPLDQEIYAEPHYQITTSDPFSQIMEGSFRPGHYNGVLTIVMKLLMLTKPDRAYFGEKDYQQLELVKRLISAFFLDIDIIACPTVRETSGLALSSRNSRLSSQQKKLASQLYHTLQQPISLNDMKQQLTQQGFEVDYIERHQQRTLTAAKLGEVRLIDNV